MKNYAGTLNLTADGTAIVGAWLGGTVDMISVHYPFALLAPFSEGGTAPVITRRGRGVIDVSGRWIVAPQYQSFLRGDDGFLTVTRDGAQGLLNGQGEWVVPLGKYSSVGVYREGLCSFKTDAGLWGFVDGEGKVAMEPALEADYAPHFSDGLSLIQQQDYGLRPRLYVDEHGDTGFELEVEFAYPFQEGLARFLIEREWEELPPPPKALPDGIPEEERDGYEAIWEPGPRWRFGFVDPSGATVIPADWGIADDFYEGLARVSPIGHGFLRRGAYIPDEHSDEARISDDPSDFLWGFIDKSGEVVIDVRFQYVDRFHSGLAAYREDGLWGFMNRQGQVVIPPQFDSADRFYGELGVVADQDQILIIDRAADVLLKTGIYPAGHH